MSLPLSPSRCGVFIVMYSEYSLIHDNSFFEEYGGLTGYSWYLYIILVLGNCGRLKGLADKVVAN